MTSARADDAISAIDESAFIQALDRDPRTERIAASIDAAGAAVKTAQIRPEPRISADREEVFPSSGGAATSYLRLGLPLDVSGRRGKQIDAARAGVRAAKAEGETRRWELIVDALRSFRATEYARLRVSLMTNERSGLVRAVDIVAKRAAAGDASGYDRQRLQLELAAYDDAIVSSQIELRAAQRRLATLAGRPGARLDASGDLGLGAPPPIESVVLDAMVKRGDYRAARERVAAAEAERAAASRLKVPTFDITAGVMSAEVGTDTAWGYAVGLSMSLPIFDRGGAGQARAAADRRAAQAELRLLERDLPEAVRTAHETWSARVEQARAFQVGQLARLEQLLKSAETAYRDGGGSILELLDAYRAARDARLRELELRRDASLAELDLWLALGRRP